MKIGRNWIYTLIQLVLISNLMVLKIIDLQVNKKPNTCLSIHNLSIINYWSIICKK